eukprot:gb/GECG01015208.1/.p1 GENE.gb/GECG01015208.1/~~gb/GECG01015208.1/.p1  ORF type:complete len:194 (+),score=28.74 gb/GECG01015208.1/:1-582(+)
MEGRRSRGGGTQTLPPEGFSSSASAASSSAAATGPVSSAGQKRGAVSDLPTIRSKSRKSGISSRYHSDRKQSSGTDWTDPDEATTELSRCSQDVTSVMRSLDTIRSVVKETHETAVSSKALGNMTNEKGKTKLPNGAVDENQNDDTEKYGYMERCINGTKNDLARCLYDLVMFADRWMTSFCGPALHNAIPTG